MSHQDQITDHDRGSKFSRVCSSFTLLPGTWSARAQVRDVSDGGFSLVADLAVTLTLLDAPTNRYSILIESSDDTAGWPLKKLVTNVLFVDDSVPAVTVPTTPYVINVRRSPTEAAA